DLIGGTMAETHYAKVVWSGGASRPTNSVANYSREFRAEFEGKPPIHGSADPAFHGDPPLYNPEDLLMSALSACHMLSYLAVCGHAGIAVVSYEDSVVGTVALQGYKATFVDVLLHPKVVLEPDSDIEKAAAPSFLWPLAARAQQPMPVIGYLNGASSTQ